MSETSEAACNDCGERPGAPGYTACAACIDRAVCGDDDAPAPLSPERLAEIRAHVKRSEYTRDVHALLRSSPGVMVRDLLAEVDRLTVEAIAIREVVGAMDDETTLAAVKDMAAEWKHYSKEMNHAGYVTIPKLTAERDALRAAAIDGSGYLNAGGQPVDYWCRLCEHRGVPPDAISHDEDCPMGRPAAGTATIETQP